MPHFPILQIGAEDDGSERYFMQVADAVVVELFGHAVAARRIAVELSKQPVSAQGECNQGKGGVKHCSRALRNQQW